MPNWRSPRPPTSEKAGDRGHAVGRGRAPSDALFRRASATACRRPGLYHRILREVEYPLLSAALAATRGNQIRAADLLGVNRNTLRKKIRDLDIQVIRTSG